MFFWNEDKINYYVRAAGMTRFNEDLARIIQEEIGEDREIYDIGCGISYLSLYLSKKASQIVGVDLCGQALARFEEIYIGENIKNISILNMDYKEFFDSKSSMDCVICSNFLQVDGHIHSLLEKSKTMVFIRNSRKRKNSLFKGKKQSIEDIEEVLVREKIGYKKLMYRGEFGQPLKSIEDGKDYYRLYRGEDISTRSIKKSLSYVGGDYPYYMDKEKIVGVIVVNRR